MDFHEKLRAMREKRGMSQQRLADEAGIWQSRITELEQERRPKRTALGQIVREIKVEPSTLARLADALGVSVRFLADPKLSDPAQAKAAEGEMSDKEKLLLANARIMGLDLALSRLLDAPKLEKPASKVQAALPLEDAPKVPGRAKTLSSVRVPKQGAPKGASPKKKSRNGD